MEIDVVYDYCISKKGAKEDFPFDKDTLTFKVGGKIFTLLSLSDWEAGKRSVNLKCDPERAEELRERYEEIIPGYHMNKKHWNTVFCKNAVTFQLLKELIDHSYDLVWQSLSKKIRKEIEQD